MWTRFMDMHSGGRQKEDYDYIYIEAPQKEAETIFQNRFGHNPNRVTCTCCGEDYSIDESNTLEEATAYDRGCKYEYLTPDGKIKTSDERHELITSGNDEWKAWKGRYVEKPSSNSFNPFMSLSDYLVLHKNDVLIIADKDISPNERIWQTPSRRIYSGR